MICTRAPLGVADVGPPRVPLVPGRSRVGFADVPEDVASNTFLSPGGIRLHIAVTAIAVIVAPWQFARRLRDRVPLVHRTMGRIYLPLTFALGLEFATSYPVIAWLSWVPNIG